MCVSIHFEVRVKHPNKIYHLCCVDYLNYNTHSKALLSCEKYTQACEKEGVRRDRGSSVNTFQYVRTEYHSRRESQYMDNFDTSLGTVCGYF